MILFPRLASASRYGDFFDATFMTSAIKGSVEESLDNIYCGNVINKTCGKHKHIGIVMTACQFGKLHIPAESSTYALMFVKSHADAIAGTT